MPPLKSHSTYGTVTMRTTEGDGGFFSPFNSGNLRNLTPSKVPDLNFDGKILNGYLM